ncbi:MFS transporter [Evansella vedderi]|uniref:MFS transporter n=1 Tax=Evansella vedderi TaxID=38282 RepID=UPI0027D90451|nr:MFS transporter [Evansella vedderi]
MIVWALVADCLDYSELKEGRRYDGTMYSIYSFSRKIGMGIGSAIGAYALGWVGFVSGAASQTPQVAENIYRLFTGLPIVAFLLMVIGTGVIYHLNQQRTNEM